MSRTLRDVHPIAAIEDAISALARAGRSGTLTGETRIVVDVGGVEIVAATQPSGFGPMAERPNVANLLVQPVAIGGATAALLVVVHGNAKDDATALASGAAVASLAASLSEPLLAAADVAPALRRAVLAADDAIRALADAPLEGRVFETAVGKRRGLEGVATAITAAVVGADLAWIAHVGDNRALLVREGKALRLVAPHTLAMEPSFRARGPSASELAVAEEVVVRMLGVGRAAIDVVRLPLQAGDRLVLGAASLGAVDEAALATAQGAAALVEACLVAVTARRPDFAAAVIVADRG